MPQANSRCVGPVLVGPSAKPQFLRRHLDNFDSVCALSRHSRWQTLHHLAKGLRSLGSDVIQIFKNGFDLCSELLLFSCFLFRLEFMLGRIGLGMEAFHDAMQLRTSVQHVATKCALLRV
jgi:hypothetical protein